MPSAAEDAQLAQIGDTKAENKGLASTPAGTGGGGLGGGGGASGGGSDPARGGGKTGGGYDTGILRGVASGNGYSVGPRVSTGNNGGFSGYGASGKAGNVLGSAFNLKDYLPGGKSGPVKNTFRGLASKLADVGPAHDDIFEKISNRFYQICLRDALYDCENLKKTKRALGGN
jgi:hypothetical protein